MNQHVDITLEKKKKSKRPKLYGKRPKRPPFLRLREIKCGIGNQILHYFEILKFLLAQLEAEIPSC